MVLWQRFAFWQLTENKICLRTTVSPVRRAFKGSPSECKTPKNTTLRRPAPSKREAHIVNSARDPAGTVR